MGADERMQDAKRVLARISVHSVNGVNGVNGSRTISRRDVHANILGSRYSTEEVQSVINLLVERGYLRPRALEKKKSHGQNVKVEYEVHPHVFTLDPRSHRSHGSQSSEREPGQEG